MAGGWERGDVVSKKCPGCLRCDETLYGYGSFPGGDPRDFTPDPESSTEQERRQHAEHCAAWAAGERPQVKASGLEYVEAGTYKNRDGTPNIGGPAFVERAAYGLGTYQIGLMAGACSGERS